ncbi:MAG: hypothetical protein JSV36_03775, partial [Anaerolineae bacterium]
MAGWRLAVTLLLLCVTAGGGCAGGRGGGEPTATTAPTAAAAVPRLPGEIGGIQLVGYLGGDLVRAVAVQGDFAYVGFGAQLAILDLAGNGQPRREGYVVLPDPVLDIAVAGAHVYAATGYGGLHVIDAADPAAAVARGTYYAGSNVTGVVAVGGLLYVTSDGLRVMDLAEPGAPVESGAYRPADPTASLGKVAAVVDDYAYTITYSGYSRAGELRILDVSDPGAPVEVGNLAFGARVHDAAVAGDFAFLLVGQGVPRLAVVDIADPGHPAEVELDLTTPWLGQSLAVAGQYLYLAYPEGGEGDGGLQILDVADPGHPVARGRYAGLAAPAGDVAVAGERAYVAAGDGLVVVNVSDPTRPTGAGAYEFETLPGTGRDVAVAGRYAYVAAGQEGLQVVDVSDPVNP